MSSPVGEESPERWDSLGNSVLELASPPAWNPAIIFSMALERNQ
jgi:hypothetical protein